MTCFAMVTTGRSRRYTVPALSSFFRNTELAPQDRFLLIDNDGDFDLPASFPRVELIRRERPHNFAANVNLAIRQAAEQHGDVVFLNNDIVFTSGWLAPLFTSDRAILVPLSNQHVQYEHGGLKLRPTMDWDEYAGREDDLAAIAKMHCADPRFSGAFSHSLHISFYCFRLPHIVHTTIGMFDEGFDVGGEDIDYRLRAHLAGFDTAIADGSYLLHFAGKSTWLSGEAEEETRRRSTNHERYFLAKWGIHLTRLFLFGNNSKEQAAFLGVEDLLKSGNYRDVIALCLARRQALEA